jgi:tyrosinase
MATPFVRVDIWSLADSDPIVQGYADADAAMRARSSNDPTSWSYQAAMHGTYAQPSQPLWDECRHGSWYFVVWHRLFLYFFERIVRAQVVANGGPADWALPYWNYDGGSNHNTLPLAFRDPNRNGAANPLYETQRNPGINSGAGLSPAITSPAFALGRQNFTGISEFGGGITSAIGQFFSQTGRLEQTPHNDIHVAIGGLMGDPGTSAEDPIFWLHHCNIDRLWWLWQQHHTDPSDSRWTDQSFEFFDADGSQVSLADKDAIDTLKQLDYTYDHAPIIRIPLPPKWRQKVHVRWPWPWPERVRPPRPPVGPGPDPGPEFGRELIGASNDSLRLVGQPEQVAVRVDRDAAASLAAGGRANQRRAFLDVDDVSAERNPGAVYGVYVNLPDDPTADDLASHHVGNVSLFGVERMQDPRRDEPSHSMRLSMDITELLDQLAAGDEWHDGERLDVAFRPIGLEAPEDAAALGGESFSVRHDDVPITIGRVSVHFA